MGTYHQMGHHSWNLLLEDNLSHYSGAILSPVNYTKTDMLAQTAKFEGEQEFEMIFDSQLYVPDSDRGCLPEWEYFPDDVDTADLGDDSWWTEVAVQIAKVCVELKVDAVCSPVVLPRIFADEYYGQSVRVCGILSDELESSNMDILQTAVVSLSELATPNRPSSIASILSGSKADRLYLILKSDTDPRREFADAGELAGAMDLIRQLELAGVTVLVGFVSSDAILWKAAGASSIASGKFFNLRRFTRSRFEEPTDGGGQLPYWFEENLMAFLREGDLRRYMEVHDLSDASLANPYGREITEQFSSEPGKPWLGRSWRQYMYWLADLEARIDQGTIEVAQLLRAAETQWKQLDSSDFLMEERQNDGEWTRAWRIALNQHSAGGSTP
jgi:hypothetical protein